MTCSCGSGHATYGACLRAKNIRVGWSRSTFGLDRSADRAHQRELDLYASARRQGVAPAGTTRTATEFALGMSDKAGAAFDAANPSNLIPGGEGEWLSQQSQP